MAGSHPHPPDPTDLLKSIARDKPLAIVLAGHNGSGKSTLWYDRLADILQIPLVNADRLTLSILPAAFGDPPMLRPWAAELRDRDERWQRLSQEGVQLFMGLIMEQRMPFAFETVFSYLRKYPDGTHDSKEEVILTLQKAGYAVALLFVGLASADLSILRVSTRRTQGGHDVPEAKLRQRFPRTQEAIRLASSVADMALMFDNSRSIDKAFSLVRVQAGREPIYDCRDKRFNEEPELINVASVWLANVAP
ncbi:MAG TPA: toxin [Acidobacteriaceae bacterium]|jgi:predicted ABC-type ATPase